LIVKDKYQDKNGNLDMNKATQLINQKLGVGLQKLSKYVENLVTKRLIRGKNSDDNSNFEDIAKSTIRWRRWKGGGNVDGKPLNFTGDLRSKNKVTLRNNVLEIKNSNPYSQGLNDGFTGKRGGGTQPIPARAHLEMPDELGDSSKVNKIIEVDKIVDEIASEIFNI